VDPRFLARQAIGSSNINELNRQSANTDFLLGDAADCAIGQGFGLLVEKYPYQPKTSCSHRLQDLDAFIGQPGGVLQHLADVFLFEIRVFFSALSRSGQCAEC
jgi:hypothetical protein